MRYALKKLREDSGYTQKEVATGIGISEEYYQMIEAGKRQKRMDVTLATKLAVFFGCDIACIIKDEINISKA